MFFFFIVLHIMLELLVVVICFDSDRPVNEQVLN